MNTEPNTFCPECDTELLVVESGLLAYCEGCGYTETAYGSANNNH